MFKRNSVIALVFSAFALATLCLLTAVTTAQKGPNSTAGIPIRSGDVKLGRNPGGGAAARILHVDSNGKIDLSDLAPGSYWMEVVPMTAAQKAANDDGDSYSYLAVTITGTQLVGRTKTRSADIKNWQFVEPPPPATARRQPLPALFAARILFEIGPNTGGGPPPVPLFTAIIKSKSNICSN